MAAKTTRGVLLFVCFLLDITEGGNFTFLCQPSAIPNHQVESLQFDVTHGSEYIYSHEEYDIALYDSGYTRCIEIWTDQSGHMIQLQQLEFSLEREASCSYDFLMVFNSSMEDSEITNLTGKFCGSGPGTLYSHTNRMFLYFSTDSSIEDVGFKFLASSSGLSGPREAVHLSVWAILGVVLGILALLICCTTIVCLVCCKPKRRPRPVRGPAPPNQEADRVSTAGMPMGMEPPPVQYGPQPSAFQSQYGPPMTPQQSGGLPPPYIQAQALPPNPAGSPSMPHSGYHPAAQPLPPHPPFSPSMGHPAPVSAYPPPTPPPLNPAYPPQPLHPGYSGPQAYPAPPHGPPSPVYHHT